MTTKTALPNPFLDLNIEPDNKALDILNRAVKRNSKKIAKKLAKSLAAFEESGGK